VPGWLEVLRADHPQEGELLHGVVPSMGKLKRAGVGTVELQPFQQFLLLVVRSHDPGRAGASSSLFKIILLGVLSSGLRVSSLGEAVRRVPVSRGKRRSGLLRCRGMRLELSGAEQDADAFGVEVLDAALQPTPE
jgi:hypothetical protein